MFLPPIRQARNSCVWQEPARCHGPIGCFPWGRAPHAPHNECGVWALQAAEIGQWANKTLSKSKPQGLKQAAEKLVVLRELAGTD